MTLSLPIEELYKRYYGEEPGEKPMAASPQERSFLQDLAVKGTQAALSLPDLLATRARIFEPSAPSLTEMALPYVEKFTGAQGKTPASGLTGLTTSAFGMFADPSLYFGGVGGVKGLLTSLGSTLAGESVRQLGGGQLAQIGGAAAVPLVTTAISLLASKRGLNKAAADALRAGATAEEILEQMTATEKAELQALINAGPHEELIGSRNAEAAQILDLQKQSAAYVRQPATELEAIGDALQQVDTTKTAGQIVSSAAGRIAKSAAKAGKQLILDLKKSLGLAGVDGFKAIPVDKMAARARTALQQAREAAYRPLSDAYKAWDRQFGASNVAVSGDTLRNLISETRETYLLMGGNVRGALERGTHSAMGSSLSRIEEALATIGGDNLVDISVKDLRNVQKAIRQKTALTMPGDKANLLFSIDDQIEELLVRGLADEPGAMQQLQQLNSDYGKFKQTFDRNPSLRPLLNPRSKEVASFNAILNPDGINAYQNALGKDSAHGLGYFMLQDLLDGSPQAVLKNLTDNRAVQLALGDKYKAVVKRVQHAADSIDTKDLVTAYGELSNALDVAGLPPTTRSEIEQQMRLIEESVQNTPGEKQLATQRAAMAPRKKATDVVARVMTGSPTEKLRTNAAEARTPAQMRSVLDQAKKQSPEAANAIADLFLERLMRTAPNEPIEFVQQIAQGRDIWLPLMGSSNQTAFKRLAQNFSKIERDLAAATKTKVFQDFVKKTPEAAKAGTLSRAVDLLTRVSGMKWLARTALRGTPISRTIDGLLSGTADSKARTLIRLLSESGPNSLLQAAREAARAEDPAQLESSQGEPRTMDLAFPDDPKMQALYERYYP